MDKRVIYILGSMCKSEMKSISKTLRNQSAINRRVAVFSLSMAIYVLLLNKRIEKLRIELEELKCSEGE